MSAMPGAWSLGPCVLGVCLALILAVSMAGQQPTRVEPEAAGLSREGFRVASELLGGCGAGRRSAGAVGAVA